jgi:hypothetical protein
MRPNGSPLEWGLGGNHEENQRLDNRNPRVGANPDNLILITVSVPKQARANIILPASNNATVQPGGPRPGVNGKQFFNMEGPANGTFASFGVVDFQSSPMSLQVTSLALALTQANAAFTHNGALFFYISTDTATNIEPGISSLIYSVADIPTGLDNQLSPIFPLGTGSFTQVSDGTMDIFSFSPSAAVASYLTSQISTGGRIRVVIAPGDPTVAATYAGFSNTEFAGPELTLAAPEPGTLGGASLVLLALTASLARARGLHLREAGLNVCAGAASGTNRMSLGLDPHRFEPVLFAQPDSSLEAARQRRGAEQQGIYRPAFRVSARYLLPRDQGRHRDDSVVVSRSNGYRCEKADRHLIG